MAVAPTRQDQDHAGANGGPPSDREPIVVINPATGERIAEVPDLGADQVGELARRGRAAQPGWEALGFEGRKRVMLRAQRWCMDNSDEFVRTLVSETGKSYEDARLAELSYAGAAFGFWARKAEKYLADRRVRSTNPFVLGKELSINYRPVGLVGVIGPWNYPFTNSFGDCIPALMAGNSVILKPSEVTPLTSLMMERALLECGMPEGVFQTATGRGETGGALVDEVDMIMFTGSVATGKKVMERAAKTLTPVALELGGKDPMIVCADADVERAANAAVYWSMQNAGQTCLSIERVYVEAPIYDEFVQRVVEKVRTIRQGDPARGPATVEVGSLTAEVQVDIVKRHVEDARERGAKILTGGGMRPGPGRFFEPTVMVDVDHSMLCMRDETFGPTLPIMKVADVEEAIRLANDSPFGLGGSVWTRDIDKGRAIARRVEAGDVAVNDALVYYAALELPMGGWKESGIGTRHGENGIRKFTRQQSLLVSRFNPKREIYFWPNSKIRSGLLMRMFRLLYGRGQRD